jgi:hypothetical protein
VTAGPILLMLFVALSCAFMGWAVVYLTANIRQRPILLGSERPTRLIARLRLLRRRSARDTKPRPTRDEARRIAANIAELPDVVWKV